ncbi:2-amino-3-carboxymuconate-6-semialdehyde decarboxylase [Aspergillus pseudodeflectus]|uniref:6-methylsalicylate decarboxylase n=1 Tax=Aspergillus pseudodeflectus TaxID=176178 RepID=A0ABR4JS41_9EURO
MLTAFAALASVRARGQELPYKIDTHHHFIPESYRAAVERAGGDPVGLPTPPWTPQSSLENMAANGIRKAILSVTAPGVPIVPDIEGGRALAREINEYAAELREAYLDSFGFFASLPSLLDPEGALAEIEYALDVLKADGVTLFTRYGDRTHYLGHSAFDPIWSALDARTATVFIHPTHQVNATAISPSLPQPLIDYPHETTRTAVDLIASNTTRRFPNVKRILSHAGGSLPYLISRVATISDASAAEGTSVGGFGKTGSEVREDFRSFYYDLALSSDPAVLDMLLQLVPSGRIVYGSDFPYARPNAITAFREDLDAYDLGEELREMVYHKNAESLLASGRTINGR